MIPKIIHYCWFGDNKPDDVIKYIEGWKKLCPDYKIIEWNEKNFNIQKYPYAREAYKEKKWAFVSDFVRFLVLEKYGGVYLDTDIELKKNLEILEKESAFVGYEVNGVAAGIIGCEAGFPLVKNIAERYKTSSFYLDNGKCNLLTSPDYINEELEKFGFKRINEKQNICGMTIFPSDWFYPYNLVDFQMELTDNTVAIHHYDGSWLDEKDKYQLNIQKKLKWFPIKRISIWISVGLAEIKYSGIKSLFIKLKNKKNRE